MKKFLIRLILDSVFTALLTVLKKQAKRSASKIDDKLVRVIVNEQDNIKAEILGSL